MAARATTRTTRTVGFVTFDGFQSLDLTGPLECFAMAAREAALAASSTAAGTERGDADTGPQSAAPAYATTILATGSEPVRSSSGITVTPDGPISRAPTLDTLVVVGGAGTGAALADPELIAWLRSAAPRARRVASVCTGAFLLAEAGLLDGRRATTHWAYVEQLASSYPAVRVDADPIFTQDGPVYTSAGVTAGMDLALALIEEDLGRDVALAVARRAVLFLARPGGQSQFSAQLAGQMADRRPLRELQGWMSDNPGADLSIPALAQRAAMSERHFARTFQAEVGETPAKYVERVRLEAARRRLEESRDSIEAVAAAAGFGTTETLRRVFMRRLGVGPSEYRRRFTPNTRQRGATT